ncbi:MAG: hypothetical protein KDC69_05510 [Flavobacteriaceae bacterium]|nr:hypothetical protein [Flavobacteriaceae bacterium]
MLRSTFKIHDKYSVVIEVTYDKVFEKKKSEYITSTYLFFPNSLNINSKTYPATKFYNDVRLFIKYNTPNYTFNDIDAGKDSLLNNLKKNTETFLNQQSEKNRSLYRDQVKMFAATFCSLLSEETQKIIHKKNKSAEALLPFLEKIVQIQADFRILVNKINNTSLEFRNKKIIFYADEHMSNSVEFQMMLLFNYLKKIKFDEKTIVMVVNLINKEQKYKKQKEYDSPKDKHIDPDNLLYKRSQLKKFIERVFFLNQEIRKDGAVFEQTVLALAAGLAMVFSTSIAFYFQRSYGNFTTPFFIALVLSYMMKDRIKGLISLLFVSKSSSFFYDYKIKITNALSKKIGLIKENFVFVPVKKLSTKIKKSRFKDMIVQLGENSLNEQVIQYKKKVLIYPKRFGNDLPDRNITGLTDITRLNFHRFIQYMDDPQKEYILVKKGEVYTKVANKLYYINIIQKFYTESGIQYGRHIVLMNRNGIKKIEQVPLNNFD